MADTFFLKYGNTRPIFETTLYMPDGITPYDLTGTTARELLIQLEDETKLTPRDLLIEGDPLNGVVRYTWVVADWQDLVVGDHRLEYHLVGPGTADITIPNDDDYDRLKISANLA